MTFKEFLSESISEFQEFLPIGWWKDPPIYLFHGTRERILEDKIYPAKAIMPNIWTDKNDRTYNKVYMALDPYTARGYSLMSGEWEYKGKTKPNPEKYGKRLILVFKFDNIDNFNFHESSEKYKQLQDKNLYDEWVQKNNEKIDFKYYELSEIWTNKPIPLTYLDKVIIVE